MMHARAFDGALTGWGRGWWMVALRGVAAIVFGVLAFVWPGVTIVALALLWGVYALVDGAIALGTAWRVRDEDQPVWPLALLGILGVLAGLAAIFMPGIAAIALVTLVGAWAVVTGALEIVAAVRLRRVIDNEWLLVLAGIASVILGFLLLARPGVGAIVLAWYIAAYAIVFGVLLVALGFRLRALA